MAGRGENRRQQNGINAETSGLQDSRFGMGGGGDQAPCCLPCLASVRGPSDQIFGKMHAIGANRPGQPEITGHQKYNSLLAAQAGKAAGQRGPVRRPVMPEDNGAARRH